MAVRKVVTRSSSHFRGYFPSLKNGHSVAWESQLEGGFLRILELSPSVARYAIQPSKEIVKLGNACVTYFPDLRVYLENGEEWWFEVKPEAKLKVRSVKKKLDAAKIHFAKTNRNFSVVSDQLIWREPLATNVERILYYRRLPMFLKADHDMISSKLNSLQPESFGDLVSGFGESLAWRLLALCVVGVDLEEPMTSTSRVFIKGGHRHANIFTEV